MNKILLNYWEELPDWLLEQRNSVRSNQEFLGASLMMLQNKKVEECYHGDIKWLMSGDGVGVVEFAGTNDITEFLSSLVIIHKTVRNRIIDESNPSEVEKWNYALRHRKVREEDIRFWKETFCVYDEIFFDMYVDSHGDAGLPSLYDDYDEVENLELTCSLKTFIVYLEDKLENIFVLD